MLGWSKRPAVMVTSVLAYAANAQAVPRALKFDKNDGCVRCDAFVLTNKDKVIGENQWL